MMTWFFIVYYFFGVIFYDMMPGPLQYIDEVFPWILLLYLLIERNWRLPVAFIPLAGVFLFYLVYSIAIGSNNLEAILFDMVVQVKPFLTFFAIYWLKPEFAPAQKRLIRETLVLGAAIIFFVGVFRVGEEITTNSGEILTGARYSFAALYTGVAYIFFSDSKAYNVAISFLIASLGFLYPTSKFLGGIILLFLLFFLSFSQFRKFRPYVIILMLIICVPLFSSILNDLQFYFSSDRMARAALFLTGGKILIDFFPFGSGFASFGTSASANSYSSLYDRYEISNIYGLGDADVASGFSFISDAYLSSLAQFGVVGIILLAGFAFRLFRLSTKSDLDGRSIFLIRFVLLDIVIESISDSTVIGNRGVLIAMLCAMFFQPKTNPKEYSAII